MNGPNPPAAGAPVTPRKTASLAIWSLVLGILSLLCCTIFAAIPGVICGHKALNRINASGGTLDGKGLAIAGLVTGYAGILWAFVMIPMMMAIAIPNFVKARQTAQQNICINNLRLIDSAKHQWAIEHHKSATDTPTMQDLQPYLGHDVQCPAGGEYKIGPVDEKPTCTIAGHQLPP